ncbi:4a-hydroxytetrahydrobiopterin dehydratase [Kineococcus xinjiangensis]|nr:4a-hydroxytetrahydrobiopterin dehydratase [Kineococcus xinjiangensis]
MGLTPLPAADVETAFAGLPDWRLDGDALRAEFSFATSAAAVRFLTAVAADAEDADHHPDVDWRYRLVVVRTTTHCAGGRVTARDTALAARVSELAVAAAGGAAVGGAVP